MNASITSLRNVQLQLRQAGTTDRAKHSQLFFKTGPGDYAEGDKFLGCTVPSVRQVVRANWQLLTIAQLEILLSSEWHECRQAALYMLIEQFKRASHVQSSKVGGLTALTTEQQRIRKQIFDLYLRNTRSINNWDLVDTSAPQIVGEYLLDKPRTRLYTMAQSPDLWKKRIAILATLTFIRHNEYADTFKIAQLLLHDTHDLIHKAVGWMLREVGKKNMAAEEKFLLQHYKTMPRTMLRYAIEKFPNGKKKIFI